MMTKQDVVDYLINTSEELKQTYNIYQNILFTLQNKSYSELKQVLDSNNDKISSYMKTTIKTFKKYLPYIKNTLNDPYYNGFA